MADFTKSLEDIFRACYDPATHSLKVSSTGSGSYPEVANYSALPPAAGATGQIYAVLQSQGLYIFGRKEKGFWYSDGATWARLGDIPSFFNADNFKVYDNADNTKQIIWNISAIASGTTRTITMPDADVTLGGSGAIASGNITVSSPLTSSALRQVLGGAMSISMPAATSNVSGYITSADWAKFNSSTGGGVPEAPIDGQQYARKNAGWVVVTGGGGMATFDGVLDFLTGQQLVSVSIADTSMTTTKVIQPFYTSKLDEVAVLDMKVTEKSRTAGVGFELSGFAQNKAFGQYNVRCIVSGS